MKKIVFALTMLMMLSISVYAYSCSITNDLENSLVRLHILAESDSEYDQSIKLAVRDEVLNAVKGISVKDTEIFRLTAQNAANKYLEENNIPYSAYAQYGKFDFPQKTYKNITLPAGEYYGVRIVLGSGSGKNWWCVMYPPLCVADNGEAYADTAALKEALNHETYDLITDNSSKTTVKFRILEWLNSL